jgi:ABC-type nitrate/sulfonate/bicarbonate transport system permease component
LTGVRLGLGRAVVGMVLAEMYLALEGGIGALIMAYGASFSTAPLFATIVVLSLIGVGTSMLVYVVEAKLTPWNEAQSGL